MPFVTRGFAPGDGAWVRAARSPAPADAPAPDSCNSCNPFPSFRARRGVSRPAADRPSKSHPCHTAPARGGAPGTLGPAREELR